jgi:hypothetical protein
MQYEWGFGLVDGDENLVLQLQSVVLLSLVRQFLHQEFSFAILQVFCIVVYL